MLTSMIGEFIARLCGFIIKCWWRLVGLAIVALCSGRNCISLYGICVDSTIFIIITFKLYDKYDLYLLITYSSVSIRFINKYKI